MQQYPCISGFADEISQDLDSQLQVVTSLGMHHICLRSALGKGIANYTLQQAEDILKPKLKEYDVHISCIGSAIGKVDINDTVAFETQLGQLEKLCQICQVLDCKYIRMFSFYIPEQDDADKYHDCVISKLQQMLAIAVRYNIVLLHENEKGIFGDTATRCKQLLDALDSPYFKAAFDFANFVQVGEDPEQCWELLQNYTYDIHIKDALKSTGENVVCGTGDGKIPQLLQKAFETQNDVGVLTLEPHLVSFDFFAPTSEQTSKKVQFENHKADSAAHAYAVQHQALCDILAGFRTE